MIHTPDPFGLTTRHAADNAPRKLIFAYCLSVDHERINLHAKLQVEVNPKENP